MVEVRGKVWGQIFLAVMKQRYLSPMVLTAKHLPAMWETMISAGKIPGEGNSNPPAPLSKGKPHGWRSLDRPGSN